MGPAENWKDGRCHSGVLFRPRIQLVKRILGNNPLKPAESAFYQYVGFRGTDEPGAPVRLSVQEVTQSVVNDDN